MSIIDIIDAGGLIAIERMHFTHQQGSKPHTA